jgi:hypothetical protein
MDIFEQPACPAMPEYLTELPTLTSSQKLIPSHLEGENNFLQNHQLL